MKTLAIMTIGVLMLYSCTDQKSSKVVFTMVNQTDKNVRVLAFDTKNELTGVVYDKAIPAEEIQIEPNADYAVARYTGLDSTIGYRFYSLRSVDSIRVVFNDERFKIYTLESVKNTPDSSILDGEGSDGDYRHIITEEDYNTAEECMGSCE